MSKTGDALLRLAQQNPDVTIRGEMPISGRSGRADSTQGIDVVSQSTSAAKSPLEAQFYQLWVVLGGPELETQYKFEPTRGWIADFVHIDSKTIIEIDGGMYIGGVGGRHNRAHGYQRDRERDNWAVMTGWRVIRLTSMMLTPDHIESIIQWIQEGEA